MVTEMITPEDIGNYNAKAAQIEKMLNSMDGVVTWFVRQLQGGPSDLGPLFSLDSFEVAAKVVVNGQLLQAQYITPRRARLGELIPLIHDQMVHQFARGIINTKRKPVKDR